GIAEIIKYLVSSHPEWEVSVFAPKIYYPLVEGLNSKKVSIIRIDQYYSAMFFRSKLASRLKDYDVIYVKGNYPYVFPAIKSGRPTILVVHQMDSPRLFKDVATKIKIIASNLLTGYIIKKPDAVVTVAEELGAFYEKKYGIKTYVIPDSIPDEYFTSSERSAPNDFQVRLLTVGNWDGPNGRKRHDVLLKYFAETIRVLPKIRLYLVGLSDDNILALKKLCKDLGITEHVVMKGYLKEKDLVDEYINAHIYVTATTYEGFYRPIVQAFATGMPAVVYDSRKVVNYISSAAAANHVIKSGAGKLYKDPDSFIESIKDVLNNYSEYSLKARQYALNFSRKVVGSKTEELIKNVTHIK
ncbi:MAG: glycosyltransferase family 4 protein, partial [Nitrososphaeria archaeon]